MQNRLAAIPAIPVSLKREALVSLTETGGERIAEEARRTVGRVNLPPPASVDMLEELTTLCAELNKLHLEPALRDKVRQSIQKARREAVLPSRNKDAVGEYLNRALKTATRAEDFSGCVEAIRPHVVRITAWLGKSWYRILGVVGASA
jgi:hypothetical protein